jgi:ankyrin repeat protein
MIAASSADATIMQLLVEEYPNAVYKTDERGLTPLHMLMRNDGVELTMDRVRILLGQTAPRKRAQKTRILQRRGQHLGLNVDEVNRMARGVTGDLDAFDSEERDQRHEMHTSCYPEDVQVSFQKLGQWKRLQKRLHNNTENPPVDIDLAFSLKEEERNPAAIAAPPNMQLPIHMAVRRKDPADESFEDEDEDVDVRNPPANQNEIMRVIVSAYPRGLVTRNFKGYTPLMVALLNQDCLPNLELLQLLLGMRTPGYETAPEWSNDLPLHELPEGRYTNPAMVPSADTNQLPLHVAAEEMPSFFAALESIHASYPGAVIVQDVRGRTPLHMALRNYQRIQPDPKVVSLLLTEKVAQIRDDDGFLPFDLLVGGAHNLPKEEPMPSLWEDSTFDPSSVYKKFFIFVVMQAPRPRNRTESLAFLQRLRRLPPWIRRQACTVGFVQDMLVEEMSSMGKCALIISSGIAWVALLTCFRLQVDEYTKTGAASSRYAPAIYLLASTVLLCQVVNWCISASLSVFVNQCLLNIWPWIDLASASLTIASTSMIQGGNSDSHLIASCGAAATGLLWFSLIGYFARWWHGMAVFMGRSLRVRNETLCTDLKKNEFLTHSFIPFFVDVARSYLASLLSGHSYSGIFTNALYIQSEYCTRRV